MLNPICNITFTIGTEYLEFPFVTGVEIVRSRKNLTTTCKITMPRKIKVLNGDINNFFKRGAKVVVKLGYSPDLRVEFTGYVARVSAKVPVEIFCEDEMWHLKQNSITKSYKNASLKQLVKDIYQGPTRVSDISLGGFVIKDQSTAQVLEAIKKYGLQCYFDSDGVLVAEFAGSTKNKVVEVFYDFNSNIIDNDLEYTRKEDIRIRCKGISKQAKGKKLEFFWGDKDGDLRTLNFVNLDRKHLEEIVKRELNQLKKDGFKNGFEAFGIPYCEPGNAVVLTDKEYPERNGSYLVEAVTTTFGTEGFRRKITIERKLK